METDMKNGIQYTDDMPRALYTFFITYSDIGAPSFAKFARSIGATLADIEVFRENEKFERAYRECSEIRRDYLIDNALTKRFDSSLTKFILSCEYGMGNGDPPDSNLNVTLEVQGE
jgi:hypothetical protein